MKKNENEILLGIDYGEKNIGIAFGNNTFVTPLKIISGKDTNTAIHEISRLVRQNKISKIVIGLPLTADGKETSESIQVRKFSKLLKIFTKKPVDFYNEHSSSVDALRAAISMGMSRKARGTTDHISAAIILKNYYEGRELSR